MTAFANYSMGSVTFGYQMSGLQTVQAGVDETTDAWGIAWNVNENLSVSYGEREVEFKNPSATT